MNFKKTFLTCWTAIYYYNNQYILWLKRNVRRSSNLILLLTSPYIIARFCILKLLEPAFSIGVIKRRKAELEQHFEHELAIVAIAKNEGPYIREWIEYHRLVGIEQFYFYDNDSEDNTRRILKPYIDSNIVVYKKIEGKGKQLDAYNDAVRQYKDTCRYLAFIDLDEYLVPTEPFRPVWEIINETIEHHGKGASGVGINWAVFGSSGHEKTPKGLTVLNFTKRGHNRQAANAHIKTIVNPREVKYYISPHYPLYRLGAYSINELGNERLYVWFSDIREYKNIRINHYYTKSMEQYQTEKARRGYGDRIGTYKMEQFHKYDLNDIEDRGMEVYSEALKKTGIK